MYAIIREGAGKFYTSMVFGYYQSLDASDYKSRSWIILNKEKTALIRQPFLQQNTTYLIPMVIIVDADDSDWNKEDENRKSAAFLPTNDLTEMIEENRLPAHLLQKCIDLDQAYRFESVREIKTEADIRDLMWASGEFHDAFISEMQEANGALFILFDGTWGCKVEVWFAGEIAYDVSSRDAEKYDPYWFGGSVILKDGFIYLIDDENAAVEDIEEGYCWFKARRMQYRIIPN